MVDGLAVLREEVLEFVGSKVCLDGNERHAIAHRSAQANKCMAKWRTVCEGHPLDRGGSVVETFAQDWSPVNREVQHECADSHQRASTLSRMDCSEICAKSLEMSRTAVVEMAPTFLERGKEKSNGQDRIQNGSNLQHVKSKVFLVIVSSQGSDGSLLVPLLMGVAG